MWRVCCVLVLTLQFILSPIAAVAVDEMQVGGAESKFIRSDNFDLPEPSLQDIPPETIDRLLGPSLPEEVAEVRQDGDSFVVPVKQSLAGLVGMSEISVFADVDGQFANSMAEYQLFPEESVGRPVEMDLFDSIRAGRSFSRDSHAAMARTEQAKAQSGQALGLLLPSVYMRVSRGYEVSEPSVVVNDVTGELEAQSKHMRTDVTLTATQPLFNLPILLDWRRRKVKELVREEGYRVSDGDAYVSTVSTYLSLVSSRLQADVTRDFEAQLAELLDYIEKRAGAGAASVSDMSRVRARRQATRSSRLEQESAHAAAGTEFVRLTNIVPQTVHLPEIEDVGASVLPETFEMAVATAMEASPEVAALAAELKAEKIDRMAAEGAFLPHLDMEYTDTYSLHAGGSSESQRDKRLMLVLNWNLVSGGKDIRHHDERLAKYNELKYRLDAQRRTVVQALAANYATLTTTSERIESGYEELKSISIAAEAMSKRMLSGNQSLLDLLTVYEHHYRVRSRLIDLHILEMNIVARLVRLIRGTPWPAPEIVLSVAKKKQASLGTIERDWDIGP
jgi:adhesin transport system outer membrane protein